MGQFGHQERVIDFFLSVVLVLLIVSFLRKCILKGRISLMFLGEGKRELEPVWQNC